MKTIHINVILNNINLEKLKQLTYFKLFLKEFCIRNISMKKDLIYQEFLNKYGNTKINLSNEEKNNIIKKYQKLHNLNEEEMQDINFRIYIF